MKAILCTEYGDPEVLSLQEVVEPKIKDNEVLIEVRASSANFPDTLIIRNLYQFKPELPFSPGGEVAGLVLKVGDAVKHLKQGDAVFALCGWGGFAEKVAVEHTKVSKIPPGMDYITAASLMYNYGTSYHALKDRACLKGGETLLVLGAAGGVGLAAVELGKAMGAKVIAAASTEEKLAICKSKGADLLINYTEETDLKSKIKELSNGKGVDVVYDPVGGDYTEQAFRGIAWQGRYLVVGFANGSIPKIALNLALLKGASIVGVFWGKFAGMQPQLSAQNLVELARLFNQGAIRPHISGFYDLASAPKALQDLQDRKVKGKAMVLPVGKEVALQIPYEVEKSVGKLVFNTKEELLAHEGKSLGFSDWILIEQNLISDFGFVTKDQQWIHMNEAKAKESSFGTTIAHGYLTLSLFSNLMTSLYETPFSQMGINYGLDKLRFLKPVKRNSLLRIEAKFKNVKEIDRGGIKIISEVNAYVKGIEKAVVYAELVAVMY